MARGQAPIYRTSIEQPYFDRTTRRNQVLVRLSAARIAIFAGAAGVLDQMPRWSGIKSAA
jgi:hypothetical protein